MSNSPPPIPIKKSQRNKLSSKSSYSSTEGSITSPEPRFQITKELNVTQPPVPPPKQFHKNKIVSPIHTKASDNVTLQGDSSKPKAMSSENILASIDKLESEFDGLKEFDQQLLKDLLCIQVGIERIKENHTAIAKKIDDSFTVSNEPVEKKRARYQDNASAISKISLALSSSSNKEDTTSPLSLASIFSYDGQPTAEVPPHMKDVSQHYQNAKEFSRKYAMSPILYASHSEILHAQHSGSKVRSVTNYSLPASSPQTNLVSYLSKNSPSEQQFYPPPVPEKKRKKRTSFFTTRAKLDKTYYFQQNNKVNDNSSHKKSIPNDTTTHTWPRKISSTDSSPRNNPADTLAEFVKMSPIESNTNVQYFSENNKDIANNIPESTSSPYLPSVLNQAMVDSTLASNANHISLYNNTKTSHSTHNLLEKINLEKLNFSNNSNIRHSSTFRTKNETTNQSNNVIASFVNTKSLLKRADSTPSMSTLFVSSDSEGRRFFTTAQKKLPAIPALPLPPKAKTLKANDTTPTLGKSSQSPTKENFKKRFSLFGKTTKSTPDSLKIEHMHFSQNSSPEISYLNNIQNDESSSSSSNIINRNKNYSFNARTPWNYSSSLATIEDERMYPETPNKQINTIPPPIPPKPNDTLGKPHIVLQQTWC